MPERARFIWIVSTFIWLIGFLLKYLSVVLDLWCSSMNGTVCRFTTLAQTEVSQKLLHINDDHGKHKTSAFNMLADDQSNRLDDDQYMVWTVYSLSLYLSAVLVMWCVSGVYLGPPQSCWQADWSFRPEPALHWSSLWLHSVWVQWCWVI